MLPQVDGDQPPDSPPQQPMFQGSAESAAAAAQVPFQGPPAQQQVPAQQADTHQMALQVLAHVQGMAQQLHTQQQEIIQQQHQRRFDEQRHFKFPPPKPFSGKEEEFETFSTKLKSFVGSYNPKFYALMNYVQEQHAQVVDLAQWDRQDKESSILAGQLQNALLNVLDGQPFRMVLHYSAGTVHSNGNGFEAWRQLVIRYDKFKRVRASSTLMNILTWDFKSGKDFESSFLVWEQDRC